MADKSINSLNPASALQDGDTLVVFQDSETKKMAGSVLRTYVENSAQPSVAAAAASAQAAEDSADTAGASAQTAVGMATVATDNALKAEGYAVGTQDGADVPDTSPYKNNNAKHYKEAAVEAFSYASGYATSASRSARNAELWATGGIAGTPSATNNAKYYAEQAADSANAAQDVLDSIPADYTETVAKVNDHEGRIEVLEALEKSRGLTPAQIQTIGASGHADEYFAIGDIIYIPWTDYSLATPVTYEVPHVVTHFGDVEDENGVTHANALWLMWMYATPEPTSFDAPETIIETASTFQSGFYYYTKNADGSFTEQTVTAGDAIPSGTTYYKHVRTNMAERLHYGSNDWSESAYRQWLNSTGGKNEWWTAQHASDVAPSTAATLPGFLAGYTSDWLAIFKPIKVQTALNTVCDGGVTVTTYDKFFLPSVEQMYGSPQASGVEGDYWEYWKNETGLSTRSNGSSSNTNDARKIPAINNTSGAAVSCRLRSANRSTTSNVWHCFSAGCLGNNLAASSYCAQPACVIY